MIYSLEEFEKFDKMKSKVLKYVLYKKRTEQEVRQKFAKELPKEVAFDEIEGTAQWIIDEIILPQTSK